MKILSIISVGGTQSLCGNKLKHFLCFCILPCLLCSCDIWYNLPFTGYAERFIDLKTDSVTTRVACVYFQGRYSLDYDIQGGCTVTFDSLKLQTNDENLIVWNKLSNSSVQTVKLSKGGVLQVRLGFIRKDQSLRVVNPLILIIPPSFITVNGQRITNDTLRVELKYGLKACR